MQALNVTDFLYSAIFTVFCKFGDVMHSFSLNYRKSSVFFLISALIQELLNLELFSLPQFVDLLLFLSLLKSNFNLWMI